MNKRFSLILKGSLLALIITLLLSLLLTVCVYFFDVSDSFMTTAVFSVAVISCIFSAYAVASAIGSKGLLTGALLGLVYFLVLSVVAITLKRAISFNSHSLIMLVCTGASGMLGGVLGMPRE